MVSTVGYDSNFFFCNNDILLMFEVVAELVKIGNTKGKNVYEQNTVIPALVV